MASSAPFDPPIAETRAPQLERWDWQQLERLTEALLSHEPDVLTASQFGRPGQRQFGIDTKAELKGGGCDVASCKKQDELEESQLSEWSTDFLKHWSSRWSTNGVRRFILVTTADISRTQVSDAADTERTRFAGHGVVYELWGQPQLIEKMRPHRGIVAQFVGTHWVDILCGPQQREALQPAGASVGIEGVGERQIGELRALLAGEAEQRVARGLDDLRAGDTRAVARTLTDLRAEPLWSRLEPGAQARVLRFAASAALHADELDTAIGLAAEADAIQAADEPRIAARIAFHRDGAAAGLATLGEPISRDGRQLQVALLLTVGSLDEAETVLSTLERDEPDPETVRLRVWALLMRDRRAEALTLVETLERDAGHWLATMRAAAVVRYAASLSPLVKPEWFLNANPVDLDLVRDDNDGCQLLSRATDGFRSLTSRTRDVEDRRWLLAALSNQRERREEAQILAQQLITEAPDDVVVVAWSLSRRYSVDLTPSRAIFALRYAAGNTEQVDVRIYALLLLSQDAHQDVRQALSEHLDAQHGDARVEAETWIARLDVELGDGAPNMAVPPTDTLVDDIQRARESGDWGMVERGFNELAGGELPEPQTLAIAQLLAAEAQWAILAPHRDAILSFATSEAVRIVAYIVAATESDEVLIDFVANHRSAFRNSEPPPDVRRLIVNRQRRAGDLIGALAEARTLSAQSGVSNDRQLEAELRASIGDTAGAAMIVRDLMGSAELGSGAALQWGEILRANDLTLARELWKYAVGHDDGARHAVPAYFQALSLGLEAEAGPLFEYVARAAKEGSQHVWTMDVDGLPDFLREQASSAEENHRLYREGHIPAQLLAEHERINLDTLILGRPRTEGGPLEIRLVRNGARPRHLELGLPWMKWQLHIDVSALLIAAECDLLDIIEQHPNPVTISSALPSALLDMQRQVAPTQPAQLELLRELLTLLGNGLTVRRRRDDDKIVAPRSDDGDLIDLDPLQMIAAAYGAGAIDEASKLRALAMLSPSTEGEADVPTIEGHILQPALATGAALWLNGAGAAQLARTGLLPDLCCAFDIGIDPSAASAISGHVTQESAKADRAAWLDALRERLLRGIEAGRFVFVRRPPDAEAETEQQATRHATTISVLDMLMAEPVEGGVIWFEDRQLTGYPASKGHHILELVDVLDALADAKLLTEADVRARLTRFLGSGGGLVQLDSADILPALRAAPVVEGQLRETRDLAAIRRNRSATLLLDANLKVGPPDDGDDQRPDESRMFTTEMGLAGDCLTEIWSDPTQTIEECIARSEWVWRSLRVERALRDIPEAEPGGAARNLATLCFASALESLAMPTGVPLGIRRQRRRAFATWFWDSVLAPHCVGDPDSIKRIADHLERLYLPRLTGRDPTATNLRLETEFIKVRIAALPRPVIEALTDKERLGALLGMRSMEIVTIQGGRFEAGRFWRAVRKARRYGHAKIRTVSGKRCRMARASGGVIISGAIRGGVADTLCGIFDQCAATIDRFASLLDELELTTEDHRGFLDQVSRTYAPGDWVKALVTARQRSAIAVYDALDEALQPGRNIAGDAFLPPPATALLHYLRLAPGEQPFGERLAAAAVALRDDVGPDEALRRLAGLPIAGMLRIAGIEATPERVAELGKAVTPVASFRGAEVALPTASNADDRNAISGDMLRCVRRGAPAFVAILNWAMRSFWRDPEYRALGDADQLALVWTHASRVLDAFLRRRADPDLVTRYFEGIDFSETVTDALDLDRFLDSDAASPTSLSANTILFHTVGALTGGTSLSAIFSDADIATLRAELMLGDGEQSGPSPALTLRNFDGQNLLGSFLTAAPESLRMLTGRPDIVRAEMIERAIDGIAKDRNDAMSWALLSQHARTGLTEAQLQSARDTLFALNAEGLEMGRRDQLPLPRLVVKTMGQLLPLEDRLRALEAIRAIARAAAGNEVAIALDWEANKQGTLEPMHELLEVCAVYASFEREGMLGRLDAAVCAAVEEWPAALPTFRELIDRLVRRNGVNDAPALWRLHLHLGACP